MKAKNSKIFHTDNPIFYTTDLKNRGFLLLPLKEYYKKIIYSQKRYICIA